MFLLTYRTDGMPKRDAVCRQTISTETAARLGPGTILSVRVDASDPTRVAVAPSEPLQSVTVLDADMIGPITRAANEGVPCTAVVDVRTRLYMRTPEGRELFTTVLIAGDESFQAMVALPVGVTELAHQQRITGRRLPGAPIDAFLIP